MRHGRQSSELADATWAARYGFVDELWRGRARVIIDPRLEQVLVDGGPAGDDVDGVRAMLDDLLPRRPAEPVWMVVGTPEAAVQLGRTRGGTTFVVRDNLAGVLGRAQWDVALVDLSPMLYEDENTDVGFRPHSTRVDRGIETSVAERYRDVLADLGRGVEQGRAVVVTVPAREYPRALLGLDYGDVADLLASDLGGGRIYGVYRPPMVAVVDFGEPIEPAGEEHEDAEDEGEDEEQDEEQEDEGAVVDDPTIEVLIGDDDSDDEEDVPLTFDNTLGSQQPVFSHFIAVAGAELSADGLTLIELPAVEQADDATAQSSLRTQLTEARRRADLAAIDRQSQIERIDALEAENDRLRQEVGDLRDRLARAVEHGVGPGADTAPTDAAERLDAALGREQALRWRVTQLERELDAAIGRPVDALEAENAALRARLQAAGTGSSQPAPTPPAVEPAPAGHSPASAAAQAAGGGANRAKNGAFRPGSNASAPPAADGGLRRPAGDRVRHAVVRAMDDLLRRVERGGIGTLELRRQLVALRHRLSREPA